MVRIRSAIKTLRPYFTTKSSPGKASEAGSGYIDLGSNENRRGEHPLSIGINGASRGFNNYPSPTNEILRQRLAEKLAGFHGIKSLGPEHIVVFNGSEEGLRSAVEIFIDPGTSIVSPVPTFDIVRLRTEVMGGNFDGIPLDDDFSYKDRTQRRMLSRISFKKPRLIYLASPNNPTGTLISRKYIEAILSSAKRIDAAVLVDEAYVDYSKQTIIDLLMSFDNLLIARTFSKAWGLAGSRIGYILTVNPEIVECLYKVRSIFGVHEDSQEKVIAALANRLWVDTVVGEIIKEREKLSRILPLLGLKVFPSEGNFLLVDVSPIPGAYFASSLLEGGVKVRPINADGFDGQFIRITVGRPEDNLALINAIRYTLSKPYSEVMGIDVSVESDIVE